MKSLILSTATKLIAGLVLVFSVFMTLRGHNEPGGGFVGGLIAVIAFALYAMSQGVAEARRVLRVDPGIIAAAGLGLSLTSGLVALVLGQPFMTGQWVFLGGDGHSHGIPFSTVIAFDFGVYLVVVGAMLAVLLAFKEEL